MTVSSRVVVYAHLLLMEDGSEAVEELEGGEDLALHEHARDDCGRRPDSRDDGHLKEPLFEGHALAAAAQHRCHACLLLLSLRPQMRVRGHY
jgi:hypothetical protein